MVALFAVCALLLDGLGPRQLHPATISMLASLQLQWPARSRETVFTSDLLALVDTLLRRGDAASHLDSVVDLCSLVLLMEPRETAVAHRDALLLQGGPRTCARALTFASALAVPCVRTRVLGRRQDPPLRPTSLPSAAFVHSFFILLTCRCPSLLVVCS